uniref:Uncharacterized protein n=1 Tax=Setaria viridis TaxID=4556 RepID=A0A4U6UY28_SETVI|nr:hypothetical protein SEVIR_4G128400v2 [Setaria viridis]
MYSAKLNQAFQIQSRDPPEPAQNLDCGEFQVPRTVLTPNPHGSGNSSTLDREAFVVSADKPPRDGETFSQEGGRNTRNQEQANAQEQPVTNVKAAGDQRQPPRNDRDNANQGGARDKRRRPACICNLLADLEEAGHNIFATCQANLGAVYANLENLLDSDQPLGTPRADPGIADPSTTEATAWEVGWSQSAKKRWSRMPTHPPTTMSTTSVSATTTTTTAAVGEVMTRTAADQVGNVISVMSCATSKTAVTSTLTSTTTTTSVTRSSSTDAPSMTATTTLLDSTTMLNTRITVTRRMRCVTAPTTTACMVPLKTLTTSPGMTTADTLGLHPSSTTLTRMTTQ